MEWYGHGEFRLRLAGGEAVLAKAYLSTVCRHGLVAKEGAIWDHYQYIMSSRLI